MNPAGTPPASPAPDERAERQRALLLTQPWGQLQAQLTAIAFKRIRGRSMSDAEDLAQAAISGAYETIEKGGWDPDKGPLLNLLIARVISSASNERRRKRNACEVWLDQEADDESGTTSLHERHLGADAPTPDDALHRLRLASTFNDLLFARLAGNALATELATLMKDGLTTPQDLAAATGRPIAEVRDARRRVRYHADQITKELSASAGSPATRASTKEVMQ
jgi:DNA-directed RNA polymerase specialized sigma24 family protein